ncbi:peptidase (PNG1) [Fusarium napiforme]|uniref:Peptidase (PNG1) n=1 Tax=Fusarium napiforme TaxID=42672 RepID=A0A8H5JG43_9HYPO|nr:peptidase (PNG1) [Fusarium napiforme]
MVHPNDWGVTRLPNIHVSEFGSPTGSPRSNIGDFPQYEEISHEERLALEGQFPQEEEDDNSTQKITVHLTEGGLPVTVPSDTTREFWNKQQHRSGIRLRISEGSIGYRQATIGGFVQVGEDIFGLTVAHVFSQEYNAQGSGVEESQQHSVTSPINQDFQARMGDNSTLSGQWRSPVRQSMVFDWALVEMPAIETCNPHPVEWTDVNLVKTTSGDFRPVLVVPGDKVEVEEVSPKGIKVGNTNLAVPEMPINGTPVVLATPGAILCLRGILTGEDALVNMPGSHSPYVTWVLQMDQPWLIRSGDSGSWAFDAGSGDLLGILVAGCPEMHEAYIIPAYRVFGDISRTLEKDVRLPNCYTITEQDHQELARLEKTIVGFRAELELKRDETSVFDLERIENDATPCFTRARELFSNRKQGTLNNRKIYSSWVSPLDLQRQLSRAMEAYEDNSRGFRRVLQSLSPDDKQICEDILRRSSLECFNFVLNKLQDSLLEDRDITVPALLWVHLILGERSLMVSDSDVSTAGYHISQVIEDELRSCASHSMVIHPRDRRSIRRGFLRIQNDLEALISSAKRYCEARIPEMAPFALDSGIEGDRSNMDTEFLWLPCIQVNEALGENQNLESLLSTEMGLHTVSCDLAEKIDLYARSSRFWLKDHNVYVDVVAYQMALSEDEWQSAQSTLYDMSVTSFKLQYAAKHVYGLQDRRVLQALGYW